MTQPRVGRRKALLLIGSYGLSLSGCLHRKSSQETADEALQEPMEGLEVEPVAYPEHENCRVCRREPARYPEWNAQILHADGTRAFFCTSGCMIPYYTSPESFAAPDSDVAGVWATDYETGETIDSFDAYYVYDGHRYVEGDVPAGRNHLAFSDEERAEAFVESHDEIVDYDLLRFDTIRFVARCG